MKMHIQKLSLIIGASVCLHAAFSFLSLQNALAAFEITELKLTDPGDDNKLIISSTDQNNPVAKTYFNDGRCRCNNPVQLEVFLKQDTTAKGGLKIISGQNCLLDNKKLSSECREVYYKKINELRENIKVSIPVSSLMTKNNTDCSTHDRQEFKLLIVTDQDNDEWAAFGPSLTIGNDTKAPGQPKAKEEDGKTVKPIAGDQVVQVAFVAADENEQNVRYQILCAKTSDNSPGLTDAPDALYTVAANLKNCANSTTATGKSDAITADGGSVGTDGGTTKDGGSTGDGAVTNDGGIRDSSGTSSADASTELPSEGILSLDTRYVCSDVLTGAGTHEVKSLENGVEYRFIVVAMDAEGNPSAPLELGTATPEEAVGFWQNYESAGGKAKGCAIGGDDMFENAGLIALLFVLALIWAVQRKRRQILFGVVIAGLNLNATRGLAQEITDEQKSYASPQRFAFEIKFGPYAADIDKEFAGGTGPFASTFGDGQSLMVQGEFDVQFWQGFGSIGMGLGAGHYRVSANAPKQGATPPYDESELSATETGVTLVPISLLAVYRFDVLALKLGIPVVPFGKVGLNYTRWWASPESGGTFGWQVNAGGALLLDVLETSAAKNLDSDLGINHTYLFFEFMHFAGDGLGADNVLHVGDTTWQAGLAFEF